MKVAKPKINAEDKRGIIKDILVKIPIDAITFITSRKGTVRGNHFHKLTSQYEYVLHGSFLCYTKMGEKGKKRVVTLKAGDLALHPPGERHALKALEDSEMLSFTYGPRRGMDYEKDTYRLATPLV